MLYAVLDTILVIFRIMVFLFCWGCSKNNLQGEYNLNCINSSGVVINVLPEKDISSFSAEKINHIHHYNNCNYNIYCDSTYQVKPGDTLFYIAWITGSDYLDIALDNNIKDINVLKVGQILKIRNKWNFLNFEKIIKKILVIINRCDFFLKKNSFSYVENYWSKYKNLNCAIVNLKKFSNTYNMPKLSKVPIPNDDWYWPACGKIIDTFSESEGGNKGIDIAGNLGQPILAATSGKVMYIGNVLKGYGNLIVIKHDHDYLSAYAHNDIILVTEQQDVRKGDRIATMGNSGTNTVKLHFEIRHKGKSVNPLFYLPIS